MHEYNRSNRRERRRTQTLPQQLSRRLLPVQAAYSKIHDYVFIADKHARENSPSTRR